jgi:transposase-like protein
MEVKTFFDWLCFQTTHMDIEEIYHRFPTQKDCVRFLERIRWPNNAICPHCSMERATPIPKENRHHCNICGVAFSVTVRTVFHQSHIPLQKWFYALWLWLNRKKISGRQLAKILQVNKMTGCLLAERINRAMSDKEQREFLIQTVTMLERNN